MIHFRLDSIWHETVITLLYAWGHVSPVLSHQTFHQSVYPKQAPGISSHIWGSVPRNGILGTFVLSDQQALGWCHVFHGEGFISDQNIMSAVFRSSSRVLTLSKQMCPLKATQYQYQSMKEPQKQKMSISLPNNVLNSSKLLNQLD